MNKKLILLVPLLMAIALMQCTTKSPVSTDQQEPQGSTWYARGLVESDNRFGIKLFKEIVNEERDTNIFISPLSVSMALGMTYNGADGATKEAMEKTLELSGLTLEEINESYKNLINLLTQLDPKVQFDIANSIWYRDIWTPEKEFLDLCAQYFYAQVTGMDFSDPDAADIINAWVEDNTSGKIKEIVKNPIDPLIVMFLINAIYFKGAWTYQFDKDLTKDDWFYLADGSTVECKMMEQRAIYDYYLDDDFVAVDMPYGDGKFSMTIFLPDWDKNVDDLIDRLDQENYDLWISSLSTPDDSFDVYLPKFKLEYSLKLNKVLAALGMGIALAQGADFSRMYRGGGVWIDEVIHKTFVEVNEEGTEAAAVTCVSMTSSLPQGLTSFLVNRPFMFVIRESESGTILFIGKIVNPDSA
ncbi:MAG: serpin family protein [candidate division Zixibacteria bacterium]|nr:serpin family protein [candidate division Zixibacteria bacterium]